MSRMLRGIIINIYLAVNQGYMTWSKKKKVNVFFYISDWVISRPLAAGE